MERILTIDELSLTLNALTIYRGILENGTIGKFADLIRKSSGEGTLSDTIRAYGSFYEALSSGRCPCDLTGFLTDAVLYAENAFTFASEQNEWENLSPLFKKAAAADLSSLHSMSLTASQPFKKYMFSLCKSAYEKDLVDSLPEWETGAAPFFGGKDWGECLQDLADFYRKNGTGEFARYNGFVWEDGEEGLHGVESPDPVRLSDLVGYQVERGQVTENTLQFINGLPVNNMLLYGDRGTGKSSTVKAILNEYHDMGLRMIEVPVALLCDLPEIIRLVKNRRNKFILFIDDLAFENSEDRYTALKAVLEGGLENRPSNVVIYATSNRRHLVREKFSDRSEDVHEEDSMEEKLSLADRFGITVTFSAPNQDQYLAVVDSLVDARGLVTDQETLHKEAVRWEMWYNGRSPRTARQFVDWYESKLKSKQ